MRNRRKEKIGRVMSNNAQKTITVAMHMRAMHPLYGKFVQKVTKYMAHDEENVCSVGDLVRIMETRPLSRKKRWRLVEIIERAK